MVVVDGSPATWHVRRLVLDTDAACMAINMKLNDDDRASPQSIQLQEIQRLRFDVFYLNAFLIPPSFLDIGYSPPRLCAMYGDQLQQTDTTGNAALDYSKRSWTLCYLPSPSLGDHCRTRTAGGWCLRIKR